MSETVLVSKDENNQAPVPTEWRGAFVRVVEAFREGDFRLERGVVGVRPISPEDAERMERNVKSYGAKLAALPDETWKTSACQWMRGYWDVLIDLYTVEEGPSDLALAVRVYEEGQAYVFDIQSVHVP